MSNPKTFGDEMTVDEMIAHLENLSWQGKGKYKIVSDSGTGKERYYLNDGTTSMVHETAQIVELTPYGRFAHRDIPSY